MNPHQPEISAPAVSAERLQAQTVVVLFAMAASFIALFPISWFLADPLFSHPFEDRYFGSPVLLVWPDHIEIRQFHHVSEVSPRPKDAGYTFNVAPERQAWVEQQVRDAPAPQPTKAGWTIHVKQLGPARQRIQLELMGDGVNGLIYEALTDKISPLQTRRTGPGGALIAGGINVLLWEAFWLLVWWTSKLLRRYRRPAVPIHNGRTSQHEPASATFAVCRIERT